MKVHFIDNVKINLRKLFFKFIQSITLSTPQLKSSLPTPSPPASFDLLSPNGLQAHWPPMKNATPQGLAPALPSAWHAFPPFSLSHLLELLPMFQSPGEISPPLLIQENPSPSSVSPLCLAHPND